MKVYKSFWFDKIKFILETTEEVELLQRHQNYPLIAKKELVSTY